MWHIYGHRVGVTHWHIGWVGVACLAEWRTQRTGELPDHTLNQCIVLRLFSFYFSGSEEVDDILPAALQDRPFQVCGVPSHQELAPTLKETIISSFCTLWSADIDGCIIWPTTCTGNMSVQWLMNAMHIWGKLVYNWERNYVLVTLYPLKINVYRDVIFSGRNETGNEMVLKLGFDNVAPFNSWACLAGNSPELLLICHTSDIHILLTILLYGIATNFALLCPISCSFCPNYATEVNKIYPLYSLPVSSGRVAPGDEAVTLYGHYH